MNPLLVMLLVFLAVALAVFGAYSILSDLFLRDRSRVSQRVDDELRKRQRERARKSSLFKNLDPLALGVSGPSEDQRPSLRQRFEAMVEQSGMDLEPRRLLLIMAGAGLALALAAFLARPSLLAPVLGAVVGAGLPFLYVWLRRKRRLEKMAAQLPDTFDLMARVIRAGQTMSQALQAVADEFDAPIAAEFAYCYEQQNLGLPPELALRDLARRTGLLEIRIFVLAIVVQQQTGGNLAELLDKLAATVRERFRVRGKIRTLTAEGRFQALILLGLPFVILAALFFINRSYAQVLFEHPNLLIGMVIAEGLGALWIRKLVNFDF